jgi:hypothetical protein
MVDIKNISVPLLIEESPLSQTVTKNQFSCDSQKHEIILQLTGKSPWRIYRSLNSLEFIDTVYSSTYTRFIENGAHFIHTIADGNLCIINPSIFNNYNDSIVDFDLIEKKFNCDSNKTELTFQLKGKSPWKLFYSKNGILDTLNFVQPYDSIFLNNGTYDLHYVTDANLCEKNISIPLQLQDSLPISSVYDLKYNCAIDSSQISIVSTGRSPYQLNYFKNGLLQQLTFSSPDTSFNIDNGLYFIAHVKDSNGCKSNINQNYSLNFSPLSYQTSAPVYQCDSNKTRIVFSMTGNPPYTVYYRHNGVSMTWTSTLQQFPILFSNGLNQIDSIADTKCVVPVGQSHTFNYQAIGLTQSTPVYDCDSNKLRTTLTLTGNAPWQIKYTKNGIPMVYTTSQTSPTIYFDIGQYIIQQVSDSTQCIQATAIAFTNNFSPLATRQAHRSINVIATKLS